MTIQQVDFPHSLENISFSKRTLIKKPWIITMSGLTNSNYTKHTEAATESSSNPLGFGDIKAYVEQDRGLLMRLIQGSVNLDHHLPDTKSGRCPN